MFNYIIHIINRKKIKRTKIVMNINNYIYIYSLNEFIIWLIKVYNFLFPFLEREWAINWAYNLLASRVFNIKTKKKLRELLFLSYKLFICF